MKQSMIAKTFYGLENVLASELENIGADNIQILNRAVEFDGDKELLYKANLYLRTALRIIVPVFKFRAQNYDELYESALQLNWNKILTPEDTFFIDAVVFSKLFTHSHYAALRLKDAIADRFFKKFNKRPSVSKENPSYVFNLHITNNQCTISLDSSGESLHKRGYKLRNVKAPLNEVLAAGLIKLSGWDKMQTLIDPMCGSGTIPIEANLISNKIPPGIFRKEFGFQKWHTFDQDLWKKIVRKANKEVYTSTKIIGRDVSEKAVDISKMNAENAFNKQNIDFAVQSLELFNPPENYNGMVIMNPPYDKKLKKRDIELFYKEIGDVLKKKYEGYMVWVFSYNKEAMKQIGLRPTEKHTLYNGPLKCSFYCYPIFRGSLRQRKLV
jgi:putative N6-adenine-specific DNA methylase